MLDIKPSHKPIKEYYKALEEYAHHGYTNEATVRNAFQDLLRSCAKKLNLGFFEEVDAPSTTKYRVQPDGVIQDKYHVVFGYWEAKDSKDDLHKEIKLKFDRGYPTDNILFQEPKKAVLYQDKVMIDDYDLTDPEELVECLKAFFEYKHEELDKWENVVEDFKERIPESARRVIEMIEEEKKKNVKFREAFTKFSEICRQSINPNLSDAAIEEMLVQHLLTSRIFESVFDRKDFDRRNIIAKEIEHVIDALTSREFSREKFFKPLDHFYVALENRAKSIDDWSQKQHFLNAVYEKFFQGFSVKVADTHGIVYTPQPIVDFMVKSVDHILKTEFGRSLGDEGVHILDPFTGTGNFIMRVMKEIPKTKLPKKYAGELHCNEIMLLPYYIASMNIEHEYFSQTGEYKPFEGICLVDTFELAEPSQISMFGGENTERVEKQKRTPIMVVIGNPPYNAAQANENDNNKNRKYSVLDARVEETYAKDSNANLKIQLKDPYVKAFRSASDRIKANGEGLVAFVSNASFIDDMAFDGMRKHLLSDFDKVYVLDLKGNIRRDSMKDGIPLGEPHTVFGMSAMVGVSVTFLIKKKKRNDKPELHYADVNFRATRKEKFILLDAAESIAGIEYRTLTPDKNNTWLTEDLQADFEHLMPIGEKEASTKEHAVFKVFSNGLKSNRDFWVYNFSEEVVGKSMKRLISFYNSEVNRYLDEGAPTNVDNFVDNDDTKIKWSGDLKVALTKGKKAKFDSSKLRRSMYRPFTSHTLYFDRLLNNSIYNLPRIFPTEETEGENLLIWIKVGGDWPMFPLAVNSLVDLLPQGGSQCFPFYTYDEDGSNRRENITDWAVSEFAEKLRITNYELRIGTAKEKTAAKWLIFYYVYGILHHPEYRTKYAANLRRELPRVPVSPDFAEIARIGKELADLHVGYEQAKPYELEQVWREGAKLVDGLRVEKMKLSKDKRAIIYNADLTLNGIPEAVCEYKLGNRSALEWIIDQYQVSTDKRSGITNDPNREDEPEYILDLLQKVITVSLETVKLVGELSKLKLA